MARTQAMAEKKIWSWPIFFAAFWGGFGRMMALFSAAFVVLPLLVGTSSLSFGTLYTGLVFALAVSTLYGFNKGDDAVREWKDGEK